MEVRFLEFINCIVVMQENILVFRRKRKKPMKKTGRQPLPDSYSNQAQTEEIVMAGDLLAQRLSAGGLGGHFSPEIRLLPLSQKN